MSIPTVRISGLRDQGLYDDPSLPCRILQVLHFHLSYPELTMSKTMIPSRNAKKVCRSSDTTFARCALLLFIWNEGCGVFRRAG